MAERVIIQEGAIVKKSNILARAGWKPPTIWEARIVAIVAAQVRPEHEGFHKYEIPISELLAAAGKSRSGGKEYRDLFNIARKMMSRVLWIKEAGSWKQYPLFCKSEYTEGGHSLTVQFHPDFKKHYLDLKQSFTSYDLFKFLSLPSTYSQRLYEILRSWDDRETWEIGITDLHEMLDLPPSMRKNFADFRRRVLEPAHRDISALTGMRYEWEAVTKSGAPPKKGRPIVRVRFVMGKKTRAKTRAKKRKETNAKQSAKNNTMVLAVARCRHQPVSDGQCAHADDSEGCEFCRSLMKERPEKQN